ncbi:MAG: hypothetical protein CVV24_14260 [Ignavibacteriae bacterium HGW-Ignavibacteriae-3]|nr:MAG: hypothetical protein CVV24_14260 [Ignavibacteriae bacterium HGW-Ignavibacteriae-3]
MSSQNKMIKKILLYLILIFSSYSQAQTVGGGVFIGVPQGDFKSNVNNLGYGFEVHGTLWSPSAERPVSVGLNVGYLVYGMKTERRPFSLTIPEVGVDVTRTNSLANMHLLVQVNPFGGTIQPYIEGLFGGAYIFTNTDIKSDYKNEKIASTVNYDDFTWSYGAGAGLLFQLKKDLGDVSVLFLDLKARYIYGSEAQYLTETGIVINPANSQVYYYPKKSRTDLLSFQIGVVAYIN